MAGIFGLFSNKEYEFAFNLMPANTKATVKETAKRKKQIFTAIAVPLAFILLTILILLINLIPVALTRSGWQSAIGALESELADKTTILGRVKLINGELKIKTDFIVDPVGKNVDFKIIFNTVEEAFRSNASGSVITSYGRSDNGQFLVNATSTAESGPSEILSKFKAIEAVQSADIVTVNRATDPDQYRFTIGFILKPQTT